VEFIEFKKKASISIVPDEWLVTDTTCAWPPFKKQSTIDAAIMNQMKPGENWTVYTIKLLGSAGMYIITW